MTIVAGTVALNIIYGGLMLMVLSIKKMEKLHLASSRKHINQFKTRVQKPKPSIHDQNGNN